jgi:eukaryotic-like serine/threonine-protein kinase
MELIEGTTLRAQLSRGAVPLRQAVDIAVQVASGLAAAHAAGVVHRDVKPENVMLRPDGAVMVLDFGLAKLAPISAADSLEATRSVLQTNAGTIMGTIAYMSPEQVSGQEVDARTDVWSVGVMHVVEGAMSAGLARRRFRMVVLGALPRVRCPWPASASMTDTRVS